MEEMQHNNPISHNPAPMAPNSGSVQHPMSVDGKTSPETIAPKGYLPFVEARQFAMSLNLKTRQEWRSYVKGEMPHMSPKPANVPAHPDGIYKVKGWQGWKFWLGTADVGLNQLN